MPAGPNEKSDLDKTDAGGDGIIYYPSGRFAVMVCKQGGGRVITITADKASGKVLLLFNHAGVGTVQYANGKPWLVVTADSWSVSNTEGLITERGKFPRLQPEPIVCHVNNNLVVTFHDRQSITAAFSCEDVLKTFECGEKLRRTENYTAKATGRHHNGKLELDINSIRQRQRDVGLSGSLYIPAGPHRHPTEHPGLGGLKATLKALPTASGLSATVKDLQQLDSRLGSINMMPKPNYGSSGSSATSSPAAPAPADGLSTAAGTGTGRVSQAAAGMPEDFGAAPFSDTMRRLERSLRPEDPAKIAHVQRRRRLDSMSVANVTRIVMSEPDSPRDMLVVLVVLADWSPVCTRLDPQVQVANREFAEEGAANPASPSGHVQIYKVDASEGSVLQKKYGFRTVPMFLMFYEGLLVEATNSPGSAAEVRSAALDALGRGRKKQFQASSFSFSGRDDNSSLNFMTPTMAMLN